MFLEVQQWITLILVTASCFAYVAYLGFIVPKLLPDALSELAYHFSSAFEKRSKIIDSITHLLVCVLDSIGIIIILGLVFVPFIIMAI